MIYIVKIPLYVCLLIGSLHSVSVLRWRFSYAIDRMVDLTSHILSTRKYSTSPRTKRCHVGYVGYKPRSMVKMFVLHFWHMTGYNRL